MTNRKAPWRCPYCTRRDLRPCPHSPDSWRRETRGAAQPEQAQEAVAFTDEHLAYVNRYGGNCRDCADENGVCPNSGLPCGGREKAIRFVFNALTYGINNGFISSPFATQPAALTSEAEAVAIPQTLYVEARQCTECGHVGINDDTDVAACNSCDWRGPSPVKDHCPGCGSDGTMTTACPECGARSILLAEAHLPIDPVGINGQTEAETSATASVAGLSAADTDRLDFMQATQQTPWRCTETRRVPSTRGPNEWDHQEVFLGWSATGSDDDLRPTIREAIDLAMSRIAAGTRPGQSGLSAAAPAVERLTDEQVGQLEYAGNSVSFIHSKMRAYRTGIDDAWQAMREAGFPPDGNTRLSDAIRTALTAHRELPAAQQERQAPQAAAAVPLSEEACEWSRDGIGDDVWFPACGGDPWTFGADDPTKNGMRFCIHCGKRLVLFGITPPEGAAD
jgi:hypothetical protein